MRIRVHLPNPGGNKIRHLREISVVAHDVETGAGAVKVIGARVWFKENGGGGADGHSHS